MPPAPPRVFKSNPSNGLTLQLQILSPAGPDFAITPDPSMPEIKLRASVVEWDVKENQSGSFAWNVTLTHAHGGCRHMQAFNASKHKPISAKSVGGDWTIPFSQIRGGKLDLSVTTTAKSVKGIVTTLSVSSRGLRVVGSKLNLTKLSASITDETLKKIAQHESSLRQFKEDDCTCSCPYFSEDNYGGAGLFQITPANADEIWNWRVNLASAARKLNSSRATARRYPALVRNYPIFKDLVREFISDQKEAFIAAKKKATPNATAAELVPPDFKVVLPDFTEDELLDDAIRGFNGFGGQENLGHHPRLHEFEVPTSVDQVTGKLRLDAAIGPDGKTATLKWRRVDKSRRFREVRNKKGEVVQAPIGDPDYVNNVKNQKLRF